MNESLTFPKDQRTTTKLNKFVQQIYHKTDLTEERKELEAIYITGRRNLQYTLCNSNPLGDKKIVK